jgi:hypothetical protein
MHASLKSIRNTIKLHKYLILLFLILLVALFIRTYEIHRLSIFIADQAIMSTETLNILRGNFTLLGPKASIAPLFFGPIVFYLMTPYYFLFNGYPLAGTVFQTSLQIFSIPLVYFIGKKVKNEQVGLIAAFLFAISGLFVEYSRASFNTTTALSFSTVIIFLFFSILNKYTSWKVLVMGILIGCMIQMNFITVSLPLTIATFPFLFYRQLRTFKFFLFLILGTVIGFSPYIIFEIRHDFYNTQAMIAYLFHGGSGKTKSVMYVLYDVPVIISKLFYGMTNLWLGIATALYMMFGVGYIIKKKENNLYLNFLLYSVVMALIISLLYGRHLESIYIISIHTALLVIFSAVTFFLFKKRLLLFLFLLLIVLFNAPQWNLQKPMQDLQDGLLMSDFQKAARLIQKNDMKAKINVAMDAQRDNRAMPLRYFLLLDNIPVLNYDNYKDADTLYFIVRKTKNLKDSKLWEYKSFGPSEVVNAWDINDQYIMYKLKKAKTP